MPLNFQLSKRYGIRLLTGANPVHEIGTGFADTGEDIDKLVNNGGQDWLIAGVVGSSSWSFTASINGAGEVGSTGTIAESVAWLPDPVVTGALIRTVTPKITPSLPGLKPTLPASGKYVSCAIELAPKAEGGGNAAATVSINTGVAKASQAEAEAAPPATTAGKIQVRMLIVENNSGTYEIKSQKDVRPWAVIWPLNVIERAASCTVASGECVKATGALTATVPAAAGVYGVLANGHAVTVKAGSGSIYGDFLEGVSECKLVGYQHLIIQTDGTNLFIIAGEPKREQGFGALVERESDTEYEPSATRPVEVVLTGTPVPQNVYVGGVGIGELETKGAITFTCPAGVKWLMGGITGHKFKSSYRVL